MNNFDVLSLTIESLLAVLAIIITIIQWFGEIRARKEELKEEENRTKEKESIGRILNEVMRAKTMVDSIIEFKNSLDMLSQQQDNDPGDILNMINGALNKYEYDFKEIEPSFEKLYVELIENEERFPMAHGYGRYINDLRRIINFEDVKRQRRNNGYDQAYMNFCSIYYVAQKKGVLNDSAKQALGMEVEKMVQAIEPYFDHADLINAVIFELNAKYNKIQKDEAGA